MANSILGRKVAMTHLFDEIGQMIPVTVVEAGPCHVLQVKTEDGVDGYRALQLGFGRQKAQRVTKPERGHYAAAKADPCRFVREVEYPEDAEHSRGETITCDQVFAEGDVVDVIGTSKGKGFAGTIKRHNFSRGPKTHGSKNYREQGSTGMHTYPGRVLKGKKMPGQLGNKRTTVQHLKVVRVDAPNNLLYIHGAIPGANGGFVTIRKSIKRRAAK